MLHRPSPPLPSYAAKKNNLRICKKNCKNFSNVIVYLDQWTSDCSICQFDFSWRHFVFNQRAEVEQRWRRGVKLVITSLQQPLLMLPLITSPSRLLISRQILRQDQFEEEKTRGAQVFLPLLHLFDTLVNGLVWARLRCCITICHWLSDLFICSVSQLLRCRPWFCGCRFLIPTWQGSHLSLNWRGKNVDPTSVFTNHLQTLRNTCWWSQVKKMQNIGPSKNNKMK